MTKTEFLALIEEKRSELFQIVSKNGLNSNVTLQYSQEIDQLLNQYNNAFLRLIFPAKLIKTLSSINLCNRQL